MTRVANQRKTGKSKEYLCEVNREKRAVDTEKKEKKVDFISSSNDNSDR